MSNNKAREINSPLIEELINETTPEELAKIDTEMTNNKQQTAVEWLMNQALSWTKNTKTGCHHIEFPNDSFEQAKEMEVAGKEMSYADGYAQGYKRATELVKWGITKKIKGNK
jgi:hypothetical protein